MSQPKVLVIGASRGIGQGLVQKLNEVGFDTYGTIRGPSSGPKTVQVDLNDPDAVSLQTAAAKFDALDILIINGAICGEEPYLSLSPDRHREYYQTNVVGPLSAAQAFLPALRKGKHRLILLMSSMAGNATAYASSQEQHKDKRFPFTSGPYNATKAALNMLGIGLYSELVDQGFSVLVVHPGLVRTSLASDIIANVEAMPEKLYPVTEVEESVAGLVNLIKTHIDAGKQELKFLKYNGDVLKW